MNQPLWVNRGNACRSRSSMTPLKQGGALLCCYCCCRCRGLLADAGEGSMPSDWRVRPGIEVLFQGCLGVLCAAYGSQGFEYSLPLFAEKRSQTPQSVADWLPTVLTRPDSTAIARSTPWHASRPPKPGNKSSSAYAAAPIWLWLAPWFQCGIWTFWLPFPANRARWFRHLCLRQQRGELQ
ncbi:hypothetical protein BJX66DRAFT_294033 [Aspergillus keveii]|uniref:Uncharacterized protein n=1 Tax=Aspergillus keveii TaxID=714993 RepID=A0ABR4GKN7_9EURO